MAKLSHGDVGTLDPVYFSCYFGIEKLLTYTTTWKTNTVISINATTSVS